MPLFQAIAAHAAADPQRIALDALDGAPITYGALWAELGERSLAMMARFETDRAVALQSDHGAETSIVELALLRAKIPVLSLPAFFTREQSRHAIALCGADPDPIQSPSGTARSRRSASVPLPSGTARITFTSGSTGTPKGICLSADHMLTVAQSIVAAVGAEHAGGHLALLPPGILLETVAGFFPTLLAGGCYVCPPQAIDRPPPSGPLGLLVH